MTVEHELIKATGIGKAGGEPRRAFLKRLLKSVDEAVKETPDLWAELSEPAQDWVNDASVKHNAQEPLPEFQDSEEVGAMTVEHELIKATGIGKAGGEPRRAFLKRLLKSVDEAAKGNSRSLGRAIRTGPRLGQRREREAK